jgi:hypothetical protein
VIPRRNLFASGALLLIAVILTVRTHDYTILIGGVIFFLGFAFLLWQRNRSGSR